MKFHTLAAFVAFMASAVNAAHTIHVYPHSGCTGSALVCSNINDSTFCCRSSTTVFASTRVSGDYVLYRAHASTCSTSPFTAEVSTGQCLSPTFAFHAVRSRYTSSSGGGGGNGDAGPPRRRRAAKSLAGANSRASVGPRDAQLDPDAELPCAEPDSVEFYDKKTGSRRIAKIPKGKLAEVAATLEGEVGEGSAEIIKSVVGWQ